MSELAEVGWAVGVIQAAQFSVYDHIVQSSRIICVEVRLFLVDDRNAEGAILVGLFVDIVVALGVRQ